MNHTLDVLSGLPLDLCPGLLNYCSLCSVCGPEVEGLSLRRWATLCPIALAAVCWRPLAVPHRSASVNTCVRATSVVWTIASKRTCHRKAHSNTVHDEYVKIALEKVHELGCVDISACKVWQMAICSTQSSHASYFEVFDIRHVTLMPSIESYPARCSMVDIKHSLTASPLLRHAKLYQTVVWLIADEECRNERSIVAFKFAWSLTLDNPMNTIFWTHNRTGILK